MSALVLAIQIPFIDDPFGIAEMNGGAYTAVFAQIWHQHGFLNLRGVPVACTEFTPLAYAIVDLHHPPAFFWLSAWGTREWQIRLVSVLALVLACAALWQLLAPPLGPVRATLASMLLGVFPCTAVSPRTSLEMSVLAAALWAWVFARGLGARGGRAPGVALALIAAAGVWIDWPFTFWIAAVTIVTPRGRWWRATLTAGIASLASLAGLFAWMSWASKAPALPPQPHSILAELLAAPSVLARPPAAAFLAATFDLLTEGYGIPTLVLALVALPFLIKSVGRLGVGLAVAPLPFAIVFANHSSTHVFFQAYLAPLIAASIAAIPLPSPALRRTGLAAACALVAWHAWTSISELRDAGDPIMRDLGRVIDGASADLDDRGGYRRLYRVLCNLPYGFAYYTRSPFMVPGAVSKETVEREVANPGSHGLRYVLLKVRVEPPDSAAAAFLRLDPRLLDFLERFPKRRHAALERRVPFALTGDVYVIEECWEYRLVD